MELSEVVSAHFAFPVVGVVLCAVLVFAFGFKSPVQPPSFDLLDDDDDRKYKKYRQKKHKSNIDGHVINIDGHGSPGTKATVKQQTATVRQVSNVGAELQLAKTKLKKPKAATDFGATNESPAEEEDEAGVSGEWTTAVSKKDRKNRVKKDDVLKKDDFVVPKGEKSPLHEIPKTSMMTNSTFMISSSRDEGVPSRTYRKAMEVTVTAPAPCPTLSSNAADQMESDSLSTFSSKVKTTIVRVSVPSADAADSPKLVQTALHSSTQLSSSVIQKPPAGVSEEELDSTSKQIVQLSTGEDSSEALPIATAILDSSKTHSEAEEMEVEKDVVGRDVTVRDSKPTRSPKKKKKSPKKKKVPTATLR